MITCNKSHEISIHSVRYFESFTQRYPCKPWMKSQNATFATAILHVATLKSTTLIKYLLWLKQAFNSNISTDFLYAGMYTKSAAQVMPVAITIFGNVSNLNLPRADHFIFLARQLTHVGSQTFEDTTSYWITSIKMISP